MDAKHVPQTFVAGWILAFLLTPFACPEWVCVARVIDGDTFVTSDGTKVRVKDIDTPETRHPTKGREPGGVAATELARCYLEGKEVWLEGTTKDKYGRRVAAVELQGGTQYADVVRLHGYDKNSSTRYLPSRSPRDYLEAVRSGVASASAHRQPSPGLTWVRGYHRKDGTWVTGHWRRTSSSSPASYAPTSTAPRYTPGSPASASGKVHVRAYYRRDGTYVRSHYRSRPTR